MQYHRHFLRQVRGLRARLTCNERTFTTCLCLRRGFQEDDYVVLREKKDALHDGRLVKLKPSQSTHTHKGVIKHDEIIGKQARQVVQSSRGSVYRIHNPTLAEYVRLTPRNVTPIYPSDANLIVSLLDIHVDTPNSALSLDPPLEILEAGTGHGALTLHLSRAIHAANPPRPQAPQYAVEQEPEDAVYLGESLSDLQESSLEAWRKGRRAIVHTLDISRKHSTHARKVVQDFRKGLYAGNVDFHVGDVSAWIASQKASRQSDKPFLTHALLDLPNADRHLATVAEVLQVNGILTVFNPSITQIAECVEEIREKKLPYLLDQVVELGAATIREWDVRAVKPRADSRMASLKESSTLSTTETKDGDLEAEARDVEMIQDVPNTSREWAMICRPKAGQQVVGGGFLGLWRRMEPGIGKSSASEGQQDEDKEEVE